MEKIALKDTVAASAQTRRAKSTMTLWDHLIAFSAKNARNGRY